MSERKGGCPATGKVMHWTRKQARDFIKRHHYKNHQAYRCEHCNYFHVGGEHGTGSRIEHRTGIGMTPIPDAARALGVSQTVIRLLIKSGKSRGDDDGINSQDLERIQQAMWRQA